jgi:putative oxidoreductase
MDVGRLAVRGIVGPLFVGHGTQKLFGWFGGYGPEGTGGFFETLGLRPGKRHATAAGVAETAGGALLTLGALTPVASTLISATMITAIRKAHISNGPWVTNGGYEYNLSLIGLSLALAETGPGNPSVDDALFPGLKGTRFALLAAAAAGIGSYLATHQRFNESGPVPAPEEGQVEQVPSDLGADEPERKFTREETPAPAGETA